MTLFSQNSSTAVGGVTYLQLRFGTFLVNGRVALLAKMSTQLLRDAAVLLGHATEQVVWLSTAALEAKREARDLAHQLMTLADLADAAGHVW